MDLIWVLSTFGTNISCPLPTPPLLPASQPLTTSSRLILTSLVPGRAKDYYFHLQTGRATTERLLPTSWEVFSSVGITERHLQLVNPEAPRLFPYTSGAQGQTPLGDISWQGSLTAVVLGYLCILVLFKNAVAEGEAIKPSVAQLDLEKYTLPKALFPSVSAAHYPFCYWHLHLSDPGTSALREEHP